MNKKILIPIAALVVLGGLGAAKVGTVYAQDNEFRFPPMIQKIIEKFGLDESEVAQLMQENREERQAEHQAMTEEKLNEFVAEGKLTEGQKSALLAKIAERQENMDEWKDLTPEERREKAVEHRAEMEAWAEENGINLEELGLLGRGFGMGPGGPGGDEHRLRGPKDGFGGFGDGKGRENESSE